MSAFANCVVLVASEQPAVALELDDALRRLGCTTLGPVDGPAMGKFLVRHQRPSLALLDASPWAGGFSPLAEFLALLEIPFATVATPFEHAALEPGLLRRVARLTRPFTVGSVQRAVCDLQAANLSLEIEAADLRIKAGTQRLARQVRTIERLAASGHDTRQAEALQREIGQALRLMRTSRALLADQLRELRTQGLTEG
jgi:hypothetical protein